MKKLTMSTSTMMLLAALLTSCGADIPDVQDLQSEVSKQVEAQGLDRPDNVGCSGVVSISAGMSVVCELIYDDQRNRSAEVNINRVGPDGIGMDVDIVDDRR